MHTHASTITDQPNTPAKLHCIPAVAGAAAVLLLSSPASFAALAAAYPEPSAPARVSAASRAASQQQQQQQQQQATPGVQAEDAAFQELVDQELAMPKELQEFLELYASNKAPTSARALDAARAKVGFTRTVDGRVVVVANGGERFQVKPDMAVPGALLLRDKDGYCYYLPPAESDSELQQIDLSDDVVVAQLFANHMWEDLIEPLEAEADGDGRGEQGRLVQLQLSEREFRGVISLLQGGEQMPEQPLEGAEGEEAED